ncbi:uncharacterized protein LOC143149544 [Ptiloglossa arizonensis]|uniref:uncharacterized protein LOC143149544 n=1 Tax=Ptiloglossa arizonensis TaxID=3350558 RepID=UPI003FA028C1
MKFLVLVLAVVPIYATSDVFGDLLGQEFQYATIDHVREKRQPQKYSSLNQAPAHVQQILQAQNTHTPLVPIPQQPLPNFGSPQSAQNSQYRPQPVQNPQYRPLPAFGPGGQLPNYKKPIFPQQQQQQPQPQQPQYRPLPNYAQQIIQQTANKAPQQPNQPIYNVPRQQQSSKLPAHIQQLLQYQSNLGNAIP